MTTEEKMQHFLDNSMMNARKQAYDLIKEYYAAADKMFEEYKKIKTNEAEARIEAEISSMKRQINKEMSSEQILIRKELSDKQEELETKLFAEVTELLAAYKKTPAYKELLISQIKDEKEFAGNEEMIIYIDLDDQHMKSELEAATGCELIVSEYSFIGGTRAITNSKKILIDNSFETLLNEEREKFVFQGGRQNG